MEQNIHCGWDQSPHLRKVPLSGWVDVIAAVCFDLLSPSSLHQQLLHPRPPWQDEKDTDTESRVTDALSLVPMSCGEFALDTKSCLKWDSDDRIICLEWLRGRRGVRCGGDGGLLWDDFIFIMLSHICIWLLKSNPEPGLFYRCWNKTHTCGLIQVWQCRGGTGGGGWGIRCHILAGHKVYDQYLCSHSPMTSCWFFAGVVIK